MDILNKPEFIPDPDPFNVNEWCEKIVRQVNETEEAFIFSTIKPFINSITTMEISKEELVRAIQWVRWNKECENLAGYSLDRDWNTASEQELVIRQAYDRGVKDGIAKERARAEEAWKSIYKENNKS